jgi:hypothetical protein
MCIRSYAGAADLRRMAQLVQTLPGYSLDAGFAVQQKIIIYRKDIPGAG